MSGGRRIVVAAVDDARLEPDPIDPGAVISGSPEAAGRELARSPDGWETGVWSCEPGSFRDVEVEESFVVIAGSATIEDEHGRRHEVGPGDVCVLPAGARTVWTVHERLLKAYVLRAAG